MSELVTLRSRPPVESRFALFAKGFRPHFLLAAAFAVLGVPAWILARSGLLPLGDHLLPTVWHGHEMAFGFAGAVIGGFLLTAVSNWTKRQTAVGLPLAGLCLVWLAGRVAVLLGGVLDPGWIAAIACLYLPLLAVVIGRPIVLARSRRNYGVVGVVLALSAAQVLTHVGALSGSVALETRGPRVGVGIIVILILVIGGRIIPIFTRNGTGAEGIRTVPWLDRLSIASAAGLVLLDALAAPPKVVAAVAVLAAVTALLRARGWGTGASGKEPLLWVLHAGYLFVPLGFALRAAAALIPSLRDATALHALTVGGIGVLTLGMMARVSLGHTGRPLKAGRALGLAFALVIAATVVRVVGGLVAGRLGTPALHLSATLWSVAFVIYLVRTAPMLLRSRPDGKDG